MTSDSTSTSTGPPASAGSNSHLSTGAIVGIAVAGVVGLIVLLVIVLFAFFLCKWF